MEITTIFRRFIIVFMLLLVSFSVLFVILKPTHNNTSNPEIDKTSHVGKLILKKQQTTLPETDYLKNKKEEDSENNQEFNQTSKNKDQQLIENFIQQTNSQNETSVEISQETSQTKSNNLNSIQQELSEKYNNDPNAEISEEDFIKYMNKIIETLPKE